MNTSKQINIMVALVFLSVLATGAYTMWDPSRTSDARKDELHRTVERGAFLFSQNCIVCHGDSGEGGSASNRLKVAPAINRPDLQGIDPTTKLVSKTDKAQQFKFIVNTIACGRIGKAMPTWGQSHGGTLNDEQIRQLATMITEGTGWEMSKEFAITGDHEFHYTGYASAGLKLTQALDASSTTVFLSDVSVLGKGLRIAVPLPGEDPAEEGTPKVELMLITESPNKDQKTIVVERGLGSTSPVAHDAGAGAWLPPVPPDPAPITQPACGQNLPAAVPTAGAAAPSATLSIIAQGTAWDTTTLVGIAGVPLSLNYDNRDAGVAHNINFFNGADATAESIASTEIAPGPETLTLNFGPLDAGDYFYHCDIHPGQMEGTLSVVEAGAAPAAGAPPTAAADSPAADATPSATP